MARAKKSTSRRKSAGKGTDKPAGRASARLTDKLIADMQADFSANGRHKIMQNAITHVSIRDLAWQHDVVKDDEHVFSIKLDDWAVTDQKSSGRCWMFAALNLFRIGAAKKLKGKDFEFSQNYTLFWDKLEKANYFLEAIIKTADRDVDDRTVKTLLGRPADDGGQWSMFVNLIKKHGLMPKSVMPETESSSSTGMMNGVLVEKLRGGAKMLRDLHAGGAKVAELRAAKLEILNVVYRVLAIHLGDPPAKFDWQWKGTDKKVHRQRNMTPKTFAQRYVTVPLDEYVCLVHDPRKANPIGRTFTVEHLGNIVGGDIVTYLNVDVELIKRITLKTLQDGEPVWFGCDVGKDIHNNKALLDAGVKDLGAIYNTTFEMDKEARLHYSMTAMTHAMLFTGVDVVAGKPRAWRVENSWGAGKGKAGFYRMNNSWFNEHMFEIAARKKYLPPKLRDALARKPIVLPAWDPMGSLA